MPKKQISKDRLHKIPKDLQKIITDNKNVSKMWADITPLARNEWICWIISAKKNETKDRRIKIMCENLIAGKRRPCCWAGCGHRRV
jgi:uncharacterized protein YdeI (YjbR/CyaY-like superfamily)